MQVGVIIAHVETPQRKLQKGVVHSSAQGSGPVFWAVPARLGRHGQQKLACKEESFSNRSEIQKNVLRPENRAHNLDSTKLVMQ